VPVSWMAFVGINALVVVACSLLMWSDIKAMWKYVTWERVVSAEQRMHTSIQTKFPKTLATVEWILEGVLAFISKAWVSVVISLLLVALVAADVISVIVLVSVWLAWWITIIGLSREEWIKRLSIPTRLVVLLLIGYLLALGAQRLVSWSITQYNAHHAMPIPLTREDIIATIKKALGQLQTSLLSQYFCA
jgi:hypothetical protein